MANVLGELFEEIAAAIREKTGDAQAMKPVDFPEKIGNISTGADVSGVTATAADVLEGKTIVDASGNEVAGSIAVKNAVNTFLHVDKDTYTIPAGYHDGTGKVSVSSVVKTVTPTKETQTVYDDTSVNARFLDYVTVEPIPEKYQDITNVTARSGDVRVGKVFVDAEGNEVIGTLIPAEIADEETTVLAYGAVGGFALDEEFGAYTPGYVSPAPFVLEENTKYAVWWDGETYPLTAFAFSFSGYPIIALGNASSLNQQGNGEPFLIVYNAAFDNTQIYSTQNDESHYVGIYLAKVSGAGGTSNDEIWANADTANSLVGSGIIRYVTFKNHDGTVEYGRKSVIKGDDCKNPVAENLMDTPTKESTPQYHYTYAGWATEPNGGLDSNALKAVTEDRTVYANFASVLRSYNITFYDSDGTTVLTTKTVTYGSVPSHTPTKEGLVFVGWNPEPVAVTGDAIYQAVWTEVITFEGANWADIARISQEGKAQQYFEIGDTKNITYTDPKGVVRTTPVKIIGFDHDETSDGTKVGITVFADFADCLSGLNTDRVTYEGITQYYPGGWYNCDLRRHLNNAVFNSLDSDLKSVIKQVKKKSSYFNTSGVGDIIISYDKLWLMSCGEIGKSNTKYPANDGTAYSLKETIKKKVSGTAVTWWLRSGDTTVYSNAAYIDTSGSLKSALATMGSNSVAFGFCI